MDEIIGKLKVVVFHNDENLYSVIKIKVSEASDDKYVTLTGNFPIPNENNNYIIKKAYFKEPSTLDYNGLYKGKRRSRKKGIRRALRGIKRNLGYVGGNRQHSPNNV